MLSPVSQAFNTASQSKPDDAVWETALSLLLSASRKIHVPNGPELEVTVTNARTLVVAPPESQIGRAPVRAGDAWNERACIRCHRFCSENIGSQIQDLRRGSGTIRAATLNASEHNKLQRQQEGCSSTDFHVQDLPETGKTMNEEEFRRFVNDLLLNALRIRRKLHSVLSRCVGRYEGPCSPVS